MRKWPARGAQCCPTPGFPAPAGTNLAHQSRCNYHSLASTMYEHLSTTTHRSPPGDIRLGPSASQNQALHAGNVVTSACMLSTLLTFAKNVPSCNVSKGREGSVSWTWLTRPSYAAYILSLKTATAWSSLGVHILHTQAPSFASQKESPGVPSGSERCADPTWAGCSHRSNRCLSCTLHILSLGRDARARR